MSCHSVSRLLAGVALGCLAAVSAPAQPAAPGSVFARVDTDADGTPRALQTAIVSYAAADGAVRVDLIGAVHIGDRGYYAELNARFRGYDVLLYEMVAPPGASVPEPGAERDGFVSNAQLAMRTALGLEFQLDEVDYKAANFVHADLSPDELEERMQQRGESLYVYFWRAFYASIRQASRDPLGLRDLGLLSSLLAPGDDQSFKTAMAYELADIDSVSSVLDGNEGSALIAERNQRAIDVLNEAIASGATRIGIFYGVAHMPDFERRLGDQLELSPVDTRWVDAWRLSDAPPDILR